MVQFNLVIQTLKFLDYKNWFIKKNYNLLVYSLSFECSKMIFEIKWVKDYFWAVIFLATCQISSAYACIWLQKQRIFLVTFKFIISLCRASLISLADSASVFLSHSCRNIKLTVQSTVSLACLNNSAWFFSFSTDSRKFYLRFYWLLLIDISNECSCLLYHLLKWVILKHSPIIISSFSTCAFRSPNMVIKNSNV